MSNTFILAEIENLYLKILTKVDEKNAIRTNTKFFELWLVVQDGSHGADVQVGPVESEVGEVGKRLWGELREAVLSFFCPF